MLRVDHLTVGAGDFALRELTFHVAPGDYFVLLGPSGAGKTVLLEALAGARPVDSGRIVLDGRDITKTPARDRHFGLVYQDGLLFPHLSVARNIAYGLRARGRARGEQRARIAALAGDLGIEPLLHRRPATLSGGETQRVALARALATDPPCLLLDEPLSAVDAPARAALRGVLRRLHQQGQTVLHVTHDYEEAVALGTRVAVLEAGRIAQVGPLSDVFQHPASPFVARFIGVRNVLSGTLEAASRAIGSRFCAGKLSVALATDAPPGPGFLMIRSEDLILSLERPETSARNVFSGTVTDIAPAMLGQEVIIDIGVEVAAVVTEAAVADLALAPGRTVWVSFKATAGRFIPA